jgi:hypothetical protein
LSLEANFVHIPDILRLDVVRSSAMSDLVENSESYLALEPWRNLIFETPLTHSSPLRSHLLQMRFSLSPVAG